MLNVKSVYSKCSSETISFPVPPGENMDGNIHLPIVKENVIDCVNSGTNI